MTRVRILIADDHEVVRRGVRAVLEGQLGWIVCGEATTGREAVAKAIDLRPDVVVLDISMPELNGLEAARQIHRVVPAHIVVLTVHESDQLARDILEAGARAYILKADAGRKLVDAINALITHRTFFSDSVQAAVGSVAGTGRMQQPGPARNRLTAREREVLQLLAEGRTNKEVGTVLHISTKTVETHRTRIMAKLDMHSMNELVRYAVRNQIIEP